MEQREVVYFEVWNKPDNGPLSVQERDGDRISWRDKGEAVTLARRRKAQYPHMDWVVVECRRLEWDSRATRSKILDTSTEGA